MGEMYFLYDCVRGGECFDHRIIAGSWDEAKARAKAEWDGLSAHDKGRRTDFFLIMLWTEDVQYCDMMDLVYLEKARLECDIRNEWLRAQKGEA